jgi:hypothetical protein
MNGDEDVPEELDEELEEELEDDAEEAPLFGRFDAAALLAVEGANGGEWAGLGQVLATFNLLFREWPEPDDFAESCGLLCDAGLVEYENEGLALLAAGRKLLRRAGRHGSPDRPAKVAELLGAFDDGDLAGDAAAGPTGEEVAAARGQLTDDLTDDYATLHATNEARLVGPSIVLPAGIAQGIGYEVLPRFDDVVPAAEAPDEDEHEHEAGGDELVEEDDAWADDPDGA